MAQTENYLAFDLGAESGRAMFGAFDGDRMRLEELHRFPNGGVRVRNGLHWDVLRLFGEMKSGLRKAGPRRLTSLGVDTWGVDFALLDASGELIGNPRHYRDPRTQGILAKVFDLTPRKEIFEHTGTQFLAINTLFQLFSMKGSPPLESARSFLMMPDLFHYWFTGRKACEFTDATTTQFYDLRRKRWATPLLSKLGLPTGIYPEVVQPGTKVGELLASVAEECGVRPISVVAPGSHDTASAVAAVPARGSGWAFVSSGTWSLLGKEMPSPCVNETVLERNFTNEGGVWGRTRLLKNICGMWLLEECRRDWARQGVETSYADLCAAAESEQPFRSVINVDDPAFVAPGGMPARIAEACARTNQPAPETVGQFVRCLLESLALRYRQVLEELEAITGERVSTLHIVGGGSRNSLLCQYAADATGMRVVAGPVEATALGNVLLQAMAASRVAGADEAREIVRNSVELKSYEPRAGLAWREAGERLAKGMARA